MQRQSTFSPFFAFASQSRSTRDDGHFKAAIYKWFLSLSVDERALVLALEDPEAVSTIRTMYEWKSKNGEGLFMRTEEALFGATESTICFRKFALLGYHCFYPESLIEKDRMVENAIRLCDTKGYLDTICVARRHLENGRRFLQLMEVATRGGFLTVPCRVGWDVTRKRWVWGNPSWFDGMGYFSLGTFIAHKLEQALWIRYWEHTGADPRVKVTPNMSPNQARLIKAMKPYTFANDSNQRKALLSKDQLLQFWVSCSYEQRRSIVPSLGNIIEHVLMSDDQSASLVSSSSSSSSLSYSTPSSSSSNNKGKMAIQNGRSNDDTKKSLDYPKLLSSLVDISTEKKTVALFFKENDFLMSQEQLFIEMLYFSPLATARTPLDMILRRIGLCIQSAHVDKISMDLILGEQTEHLKKVAQSAKRRGKPKKKRERRRSSLTNSNSNNNSNNSSGGKKPDHTTKKLIEAPKDSSNSNTGGSVSSNGNGNGGVAVIHRTKDKLQNSLTRQEVVKKLISVVLDEVITTVEMIIDDKERQAHKAEQQQKKLQRKKQEQLQQPQQSSSSSQQASSSVSSSSSSSTSSSSVHTSHSHSGQQASSHHRISNHNTSGVRSSNVPSSTYSHSSHNNHGHAQSCGAIMVGTAGNSVAGSSNRSNKGKNNPSSSNQTASNGGQSQVANNLNLILPNGRPRGGTGPSSLCGGVVMKTIPQYADYKLAILGTASQPPPQQPTQSQPQPQQPRRPARAKRATSQPEIPSVLIPQLPQTSVSVPSSPSEKKGPHPSLASSSSTLHSHSHVHSHSHSHIHPPSHHTSSLHVHSNSPHRHHSESSLVPASLSSLSDIHRTPSLPEDRFQAGTSTLLPVASSSSPSSSSVSSIPHPPGLDISKGNVVLRNGATKLITIDLGRIVSSETQLAPIALGTVMVSDPTHPSASLPTTASTSGNSIPRSLAPPQPKKIVSTFVAASPSMVDSSTITKAITFRLTQDIIDYVGYVKRVVQEHNYVTAESMVQKVKIVVNSIWPTAKVELYGSFGTGLCIPSSDLDLVIVGSTPTVHGVSAFETLKMELGKQTWLQSMQAIGTAKVPVIKIMSKDEGIPTDITFAGDVRTHSTTPAFPSYASSLVFSTTSTSTSTSTLSSSSSSTSPSSRLEPNAISNNAPSTAVTSPTSARLLTWNAVIEQTVEHSGIASVRLILHYKSLFPPLEPLVLVLKQFLHERGLNNAYTGGLSSYCLILLVISFIQLFGFDEQDKEKDIGTLLLEFFEYYGKKFVYQTTGITILGGGKHFPLETSAGAAALVILDPFNPSRNAAYSTFSMWRVKCAFEYAYAALTNPLSMSPVRSPTLLSCVLLHAHPSQWQHKGYTPHFSKSVVKQERSRVVLDDNEVYENQRRQRQLQYQQPLQAIYHYHDHC